MTICELIKKKNYYRLMQEEYIYSRYFLRYFSMSSTISNTTQKNIPNTEFCEILCRGIRKSCSGSLALSLHGLSTFTDITGSLLLSTIYHGG